MKNSINLKNSLRTAGILLIGILLGWLFFGGSSADQPTDMEQHVSDAHTNEQGEVVYTCSMHPSVRQSEPGNCPICGMELIPANQATSSTEENPYELQMTQAAMKLAQVQTTEVVRDVAVNRIRMPGKVMVDERKTASITAQFPGRIEQLYVDFTGQQVAEGEPLASVYSPNLITAQKELLEAARKKESNPTLYRAARKKLELWELPESTINEIEQSGEVKTTVDIVSPVNGYITKRNVTREDYVNTGTMMYQVANLSTVWVMFNAYESDLAGLQQGDEVSFSVQAYPGETFEAEVTYVDPILDPQSRTAKVRAEAPNPDGRLMPQMLAEGIVSSEVAGGTEQVLIPKSAVLWTGERSVVYVQKQNTEQPTFEFREVVLGQRVGDQYVVKSGVQPGEQVVTNGNFKIDSAAQLAGKASMMNRNPDGRKPAGHNHGPADIEMEMDTNTEMESTQTDSGSHQHSQHLSSYVDHYLEAKEALFNDRFTEARDHLEELQAVMQSIEMSGSSHHHKGMVEAVAAASGSDDMQELRTSFANISEHLTKVVQDQGAGDQKLFLQYCPMAQNKSGAYWIGESEQIANPYMGQKMPECGTTEEVLTL